jgi:methionyl-tRNA formyltransferase
MARALRLLLLAEEAAGVQALRLVAGTAHQIVGVLTRIDGTLVGATVAGVASRLGYRLWPARRAKENEFAQVIRQEEVDLLLNVQSQYVLPADVVAAPKIGSFNLHPGPLPRYAGLNAPSWAIFQGETSHGVSIHWMDAGIDTGPIAYQTTLAIDDDDTGLTLSAKCVRAGLPLLHDLLQDAAAGAIPRQPQPAGPRRYYGHEVPHEGRLLWTESAGRVVNFVRASDFFPFASPWGHPRAYLAGRELGVLKAAKSGEYCAAHPGVVGERRGSDVLVAARHEWVRLRRVLVGSSIYPAAEVLREGERFAIPLRSEEAAHAPLGLE